MGLLVTWSAYNTCKFPDHAPREILYYMACDGFMNAVFLNFVLFFKDYIDIYPFWERREGRQRGRETLMWERNIDWLLPTPTAHTLTEYQTQNPGMCLDWELNWWTFTLQGDTQPTEPHQVRAWIYTFNKLYRWVWCRWSMYLIFRNNGNLRVLSRENAI